MTGYWRIVAAVFAVFALSACGAVHNTALTPPVTELAVENVELLPVEVTSKEQNPDAQALNAEWEKLAEDELRSLLSSKNISIAASGEQSIRCAVDVTYGSRALRYFVGFGAGSGHIRVLIEMRNTQGEVIYATQSEADLAMGAFGGDMANIAHKTIETAVQDFGSKL